MQIRPPDTTDVWTDVALATSPASTSPTRGPLVTTAMCSADMRPRKLSGVTCCMIVLRNTAEITSAAPAAARSRSASQNMLPGTKPKTAIDAPHATTDATTAAP